MCTVQGGTTRPLPHTEDSEGPPTPRTDSMTGKVEGEKRKRFSYTITQSVFLEQALDKGEFDTKEGRQKIAYVFTKETGEKFDPERIQNWYRNHKSKPST